MGPGLEPGREEGLVLVGGMMGLYDDIFCYCSENAGDRKASLSADIALSISFSFDVPNEKIYIITKHSTVNFVLIHNICTFM